MSEHGQGPLPIHSAEVLRGGRSLSRPRFSPDGSWLAFLTESKMRRELALMPATRESHKALSEVWLPLDPGVGSEFVWCPRDGSTAKGASSTSASKKNTPVVESTEVADAFRDADLLYLSSDGHLCLANKGWCSPPLYAASTASGLAVSHDGSRLALVTDLQTLHVWKREDEGYVPEWSGSLGADFVMGPTWCGSGSLFLLAWDDPHMAWQKSRLVRWQVGGDVQVALEENDTAYSVPLASPDQSSIAFLSDRTGWRNLWLTPSDDFSQRRCVVDEEYEHGGIAWPGLDAPLAWFADSKKIAFCRNKNARGELVVAELATGKVEVRGSGVYRSLTVHSAIAGVVSSAAHGGNLHHSSYGVVAHGALCGVADGVEPEDVTWRSFDGTLVHGRLYRSPNQMGVSPPLLVSVHAGPTMQSPVTFNPDWTYFLARGWNVLVVDYRGSTGRGRAFQESLSGNWGVKDVDDVLSGVALVGPRSWGNPEKVILAGGSAAGLTILNALARDGHGVAGAVVEYPVCDLLSLRDTTWRLERHYFDSLIGDPVAERNAYVERSPVSLAGRIAVPLLVLHGDADESVPVSQSEQFVALARERNDQVDLHVYPGEVHGWRNIETKVDALERAFDFASKVVAPVSESISRTTADEGAK